MVVLCDGMVRSGSTWSYNVVLELLRLRDPGRKTFGLNSEDPKVVLAAARPRDSHVVIKAHTLHPPVRDLCIAGAIRAVYTWRDPYDAIVSAARMFGKPMEHWIDVVRDSLRTRLFHRETGSACVVAYESIVGTPGGTIGAIAAHLGFEIPPGEAERIADRLSLERTREFSQRVADLDPGRLVRQDGCLYDRETLLHQNHIRDGSSGYGVHFVTEDQRVLIEAILRDELPG